MYLFSFLALFTWKGEIPSPRKIILISPCASEMAQERVVRIASSMKGAWPQDMRPHRLSRLMNSVLATCKMNLKVFRDPTTITLIHSLETLFVGLALRVLLPIANIRWLASWKLRNLYRFVITTC